MIKQNLTMFYFLPRGACCFGYKLNTTTGECDSEYTQNKDTDKQNKSFRYTCNETV